MHERNGLRLPKACNCLKCNPEGVWINVIKDIQIYIIGGVYHHPGRNAYQFNITMEVTLSKINNMNTYIFLEISIWTCLKSMA